MALRDYEIRISHPDAPHGDMTVLRAAFEAGKYPGWTEAGDGEKPASKSTAKAEENKGATASDDESKED